MHILILEKFEQPSTLRYIEEGMKGGNRITLAYYGDVIIDQNETQTIKIKDLHIESYDAIYLRTLSGYEEMATLVNWFAIKKKIPLYDLMLQSSLNWIDSKSWELLQLFQHNVPAINSRIGIGKKLIDGQSYPLILKLGKINKGEGVFLCKNEQEAKEVIKKYPKETMIAQPFIENDGDLRIMTVGHKPMAGMFRKNNDPNEFRNNVSFGGTVKKHPLDKELSSLAANASRAVGYDVAGVDLIFDKKTKRWLVMEVNRSPQYAGFEKSTGKNVVKEILGFIAQGKP